VQLVQAVNQADQEPTKTQALLQQLDIFDILTRTFKMCAAMPKQLRDELLYHVTDFTSDLVCYELVMHP